MADQNRYDAYSPSPSETPDGCNGKIPGHYPETPDNTSYQNEGGNFRHPGSICTPEPSTSCRCPSALEGRKVLQTCNEELQIPKRADFGDYYVDGGWGWVVCGAAFIVHFICHGLHLAIGTLSAEIGEEFGASQLDIVWLASVSYGVCLCIYWFGIAICGRRSPRTVAVIGALISALGVLFMSFSMKLHHLFVSLDLFLPVGTGLLLGTTHAMINRYFEQRQECAEMLVLTGSGVGMAVHSVLIRELLRWLKWLQGLRVLTGVMLFMVLAVVLYRPASIYHPRRIAIIHLKHLRKSRRQQNDFEDLPPCLDPTPLRVRSMQVLLVSACLSGLGVYTPYVLLCSEALAHDISPSSIGLLGVYLGVSFALGSLVCGILVIRSSVTCTIGKLYLCQISALCSGLATVLFPMVASMRSFCFFVWTFGVATGGYHYVLKVYCNELVSFKLCEQAWGYVTLMQGLAIIVGCPIAAYLNEHQSLPRSSGYLFAGLSMISSSIVLFLMPWANKHPSTNCMTEEILIETTRKSEESILPCDAGGKGRGWQAMLSTLSPMSPTDKVNQFLNPTASNLPESVCHVTVL